MALIMTLQQIFDLGLEMGVSADPRGKTGVAKFLAKKKKEFDGFSEKKKRYQDNTSLTNPYADSAILFGDPKTPVKRVLAGIDTNTGEVLLADRLNQLGKKIDLIIAHHPEGHALAALHDVMDLQVDELESWGVPVTIAEDIMNKRTEYVARRFHPINHGQAVDAARILDIPMMALHTVWDNMGHTFLDKQLNKKPRETVGDVLDAIMELEEFQEATRQKAGPVVASGSEKNRAGKIVVGFTGGTEPGKEVVAYMAAAGVGTLVEMHIGEDMLDEIKKHHMNAIITGHMVSDSLGANLFFDALEKRGVEVIPCSGLIRVKR